MTKILILGTPKAGKSSILQEAYEKITDAEDNPYKNRILKLKSLHKVLHLDFLEENSIDMFSIDQITELFSDVEILIWVVDVADHRTISTSLFHWKKAIGYLKENSPFALKFVCFHKTDLLTVEDKNALFSSLRSDFQLNIEDQINFYYTTTKDDSILVMMAEVMKRIHESSFEIQQISKKITEFLQNNEDFYGVAILSSDGLSILEAGEKVEYVVLPANLWLGTTDRLKEAFSTETVSCTIHLNDQILLFFELGSDQLLTTIAKSDAPLQFSFIRSDMLAQSLREILNNLP